MHLSMLMWTEGTCVTFFSTIKLKPPEDGKSSRWMIKKGISYLLITITGGVALSAVDDLSIYYACSRLVDTYVLTSHLNSYFVSHCLRLQNHIFNWY